MLGIITLAPTSISICLFLLRGVPASGIDWRGHHGTTTTGHGDWGVCVAVAPGHGDEGDRAVRRRGHAPLQGQPPGGDEHAGAEEVPVKRASEMK